MFYCTWLAKQKASRAASSLHQQRLGLLSSKLDTKEPAAVIKPLEQPKYVIYVNLLIGSLLFAPEGNTLKYSWA